MMAARAREALRQARAYRPGWATQRPSWTKQWPTGEAWVYIALVVAALGTRLWDLGGRTLHYDEILHAWYSWRFFEGMGYSHTPLTHGPFLFHGAAATFALIGSGEVAVRLLPALFGAALVGLPYFLRQELGRYGAVATAMLLMVSPSILYFGRFIRNDIYMAVWALLLIVILFRYLKRPRTGLLAGWASVWALAYSTKESSYMLAGLLGLFLLILAAPAVWRWVRGRTRLSDLPPAGDLLVVLGTLSLPLFAPTLGLIQDRLGIILVNADPNSPRIASGELVRAAAETGAPVGGGLYIAAFIVVVLTTVSIRLGLLWDRRRWPLLAALFSVIWLTLFTSVFTNWQGFFTGFWGSLGYWIAQQEVERASQPWYYYVIGLSAYEFLAVVPALIGGAYLAVRGALFDRFIVAWAVGTFILFSFAGEKMPWLLVGITLPLALVAGRSIGTLAELARQSRMTPAAYVGGLAAFTLAGYAAYRSIMVDAVLPDPGFWFAVTGALLAAAGGVYMAHRMRLDPAVAAVAGLLHAMPRAPVAPAIAAVALGGLTVLLALTVLAAGRASYSYAGFERPSELLVYSQTGQETAYAAECIAHVAEASGKGNDGLRVFSGESDNNAWQWRWYLRDYANVEYRFIHETALSEPPDADVVLISQAVESSNREQLKGFVEVGKMSHLWWFPNTAYADLTPLSVLRDATTREGWRMVTDFFLARRYGGNMYQSNGLVYVSADLATLATDCTALRASEGV